MWGGMSSEKIKKMQSIANPKKSEIEYLLGSRNYQNARKLLSISLKALIILEKRCAPRMPCSAFFGAG